MISEDDSLELLNSLFLIFNWFLVNLALISEKLNTWQF
jgi:hypothetical protein